MTDDKGPRFHVYDYVTGLAPDGGTDLDRADAVALMRTDTSRLRVGQGARPKPRKRKRRQG